MAKKKEMSKDDFAKVCGATTIVGSIILVIIISAIIGGNPFTIREEIQTLEPLANLGVEKLCQEQQYGYDEEIICSTGLIVNGTLTFPHGCRCEPNIICTIPHYKNFTTGRLLDDGRVECWDLHGEKVFNTKKWDKDITFNLDDCGWATNSETYPDSFICDNGENWEIFDRKEKSQIFTIQELLGVKK